MKTMLKRQAIYTFLALAFVGACLSALLSGSLAWYGSIKDGGVSLTGSVSYVARYFESGDGSCAAQIVEGYENGEPVFNTKKDGSKYTAAEHEDVTTAAAYEIKTPDQLYNLAWLQYLGYFNDGSTRYYFYLSQDLDMTGYTLPPIGTTEYPFVGSFDGCGHTISNLTVSNRMTSAMKHGSGEDSEMPLQAYEEMTRNGESEEFGSETEIVGLFGVVGEYDGEGAYSSNTAEIKNVKIEGITVQSGTSSALAGLAAGYVNGEMTEVTVTGSIEATQSSGGVAVTTTDEDGNATTITTDKLSYYTTVGYTTKLATLDVTDVTHDVAVKQGSYEATGTGDAWGGSIDMKSLFNRLDNVYEYVSTQNSSDYYWYYYTKYENGKPVEDSEQYVTPSYSSSSRWSGYYNYDWDGYAMYSFPAYNNYAEDGFAYNVVYGGDNTALYAGSKATGTETGTVPGTPVTISMDGHYLGYDGSGGVADRSATDADTTWYEVTASGGVLLCAMIDGVTYYLNVSGSSLTVTTSGSTIWTKTTNDDGTTTYSTDGQYLEYDGSTDWGVDVKGATLQIKYASTNRNNNDRGQNGGGQNGQQSTTPYYLTASTSDSYAGSSTTSQVTWTMDENGYLSYNGCYLGVKSYYYYYYYAYAYSDKNSACKWTYTTDGKLTCDKGTLYYYGSGYWCVGNTSSAATIDYTPHDPNCNLTVTEGTETTNITYVTTSDVKALMQINDSVFPIGVTGNSGAKYYTDTVKNTGYFVGGAENNSSSEHIGNLRFAKYPMDQLSNAVTKSGKSYKYPTSGEMKVLTPDGDGGFVAIKDSYYTSGSKTAAELGLQKYDDSRDAVHSVLSPDSSSVYGLHFMNSQISKSNVATIETAYVNGEAHNNYELPRNCIDFNLKESGYINFFAHTGYVNSGDYNSTNNCFFSLHEIFRASNENITAIKEISKIYENTDEDTNKITPYVYEYTDGTCSAGTAGEEVFDTAWLTNPGMTTNMLKSVFYFEIPANPGEYALGSVNGKATLNGTEYNANGAYLFYLDIAANAQTVERTVTTETITNTLRTYEYPAGVGFGTVEDAAISLPFGSSAAVGTVSDETGETVQLTVNKDGAACSYARPVAVEDPVTVTNGGTAMTAVPKQTSVTTKVIETTVDENTHTKDTVTQRSVTTTVDDGESTVEIDIVPEGETLSAKGPAKYEDLIAKTDGKAFVSYTASGPIEVDATFTYEANPLLTHSDAITITLPEDSTVEQVTVKNFKIRDGFAVTVTVNKTPIEEATVLTVPAADDGGTGET